MVDLGERVLVGSGSSPCVLPTGRHHKEAAGPHLETPLGNLRRPRHKRPEALLEARPRPLSRPSGRHIPSFTTQTFLVDQREGQTIQNYRFLE